MLINFNIKGVMLAETGKVEQTPYIFVRKTVALLCACLGLHTHAFLIMYNVHSILCLQSGGLAVAVDAPSAILAVSLSCCATCKSTQACINFGNKSVSK